MYGMKKHRGLRRYYKNLSRVNELETGMTWLDFKVPDIWFDYWHIHFDNYGYGNRSFKRRKPHLDALFRHYEIASQKMLNTGKEFQLWIFINNYRSYDDALYFHTPNPNALNFPHKYNDYGTEYKLSNHDLIDYLSKRNDFKMTCGAYYTEDSPLEVFCALYKENIGLPII